MRQSLPKILRGLWATAILLATVSLILLGVATAQDGQIDQQITKTMWVMHPQVVGHIDRLSDIRVPYQGPLEFGEEDLFSHPVYYPRQSTSPMVRDGAMQLSSGPLVTGSVGLNFDGLGTGITGPNGTFTVNSVPPDTNMAVGTTQAIQTVNSGFAIYDKTTGGMTYGPYTIQTLWSALPSGSACTGSETGASGVSLSDPVVQFDQFAQRWIISVLALPYNASGTLTPPFYHCVAYSDTADASAGWLILQYNPGSYISGGTNLLPDYPKGGVWRDAYTFTYDMFNNTSGAFVAGTICGMDRNAILGGSLSPTIICFEKTSTDYALLPATADGALYPPLQTSGTAGTDTCSSASPCQPKSIFFELDDVSGSTTALHYYRAHFNFTTTSHSAVDTIGNITVSSYNTIPCSTANGSSKCVPQPAHTGSLPAGETFASESKLDTLFDHAMWRAAYRNFSSYESVVFDSSVRGNAVNITEPRWYELRGINSSTGTGTPTVNQQSTFNPDSGALNRWMGSIAADHSNNMLMGYSGSSSTVFPSLYITGRLASDSLSTMETEQQVFAGLNSQVNISGYAYGYRWGDYSSVVIDPDDCTFWYTTEYLKQAGLFNWSTRIFNWNFGTANCTSLASITLPIPNAQGGAALTSGTATFDWTPGTGSPSYTLSVGKTQGGSDYCGGPQSYSAGTYTATLSCLPTDGSTFWVRLTTVGGANGSQDYQYTSPSLQQSQTITFPNPGTQTYGVAPITLTATASSGLPVTYTVKSGPATVNGSVLTITGAGAVTVEANQAGNSNWLPAPAVDDTFTVNKAVLTVTANNASMTYGGTLPTFTASYSGFVNGDGQGVLSGLPSLTTTATSSSPAGTYAITAAQGTLSAANYSFTFVNGTLTINKAVLTVTANNATMIYGGTLPTFTASYSGFVNGDGQGVLSGSPSLTTTATSASPVGNYAITAAQGTLTAQNYSFTFVNGTLTINPAVLTVTANNATMTYGGMLPTFTASYSGFVNGDGQGVLSGSPSLTTTATSTSPAGTYTITAAQGTLAAQNYTFTFVNGTLTINKAVLTVTANNASMTYGGTLPTFTASYSGFVNGDGQGVLSGSPNLTTTATSSSPVGNYAITAAQGTLAAQNYTFTFVNGTLTINAAVLTVTANNATMTYGGQLPTFTASYSGFVNGDGQGVLSGSPSLTTTATSSSPAGTYSITAAQGTLAAQNYTFTFVNGTLTINAAVITVTANNATMTYGGQLPTFTASYSGFVNGDGQGVLSGSPSLTTTATSSSPAGSYTITAAQGTLSAANYTFTFVNGTLTINKAVLTVTASNASMVYGSTLPTFSATYSGFVNGDGQGVVSGSPSLTTTATSSSPVGSYPINAAQGTLSAANYTFSFVNGTLTITPAVLAVTANNASITEGSQLPTFTAGYSGFVNGDGQGVLSGSPSLTTTAPQNPPVGTYPIIAAQGTLSAQNYTFTFVNGTLTVTAAVAQITSPPKNSTLSGKTATFTWSHETGATSYQLWLGHSAGTHDIASVGTSGLAATISNLPTDGSQIYATLYGFANNSWTVQDTAVYTAATIVNAQITSPPKNSTLSGSSVTFTWTAETGATSYQVWVGHTAGAHDIGVVGTSGLAATVSGLPLDGSQIYVTLYGYTGAIWSVQDTATYTAGTMAQITSPPKNSSLSGKTQTFTWTAETGATSYQLWVGSTPGAHDIAVVGTSGLAATVSNLPTNGSQIYVTLNGYAGGVWTVQDTATYTAVNIVNAQITSPPKNSTLSGGTVTFTWTAETGATSYQIWVGNTPGAHDIASAGTAGLALTLSNLPTDGRQLYVTLYGYAGGVWTVQDTATYTAASH